VKFSRSLLPFSDKYDGNNFFTTVAGTGARLATPLMLVLICIELSDVVFALDSVPAVLGISHDTKVVYASNILAILGLRNLYFLIAGSIEGLRFLRPALAIVLGFVGAKMIGGVAGYEVGILPSLAVVLGTLGGGVGLSLAFQEKEDGDDGGKQESTGKAE
jgi:TerC family integral membrane protein